MSAPTQTKTSLGLDLPKACQLVASEGASPYIRAIGALTAAALLIRDVDWSHMVATKRVELGAIFIGLLDSIGDAMEAEFGVSAFDDDDGGDDGDGGDADEGGAP